MRVAHFLVPACLLLGAGFAFADKPPPAAEYPDDADTLDQFNKKLGELAKADKCLKWDDLKKKAGEEKATKLTPAKPGDKAMSLEQLAEAVRPSVFLLGSVVGDKENGFDQGRMATAWAVAADGVLVTNSHVFDEVEENEHYGAMSHDGKVYPLVDILAIDKTADIAVVKIDAAGLTPLPLAAKPAKVGARVAVLGHPGDRYYTFTVGHVTRYSSTKEENDKISRWMSIDAEYAYGSSGSPVVNEYGAVVAMAALTENIDYPEDGPAQAARAARKPMVRRAAKRPADDKKPDVAKPAPSPSTFQMMVKLTVPVADLRAVLQGKE